MTTPTVSAKRNRGHVDSVVQFAVDGDLNNTWEVNTLNKSPRERVTVEEAKRRYRKNSPVDIFINGDKTIVEWEKD